MGSLDEDGVGGTAVIDTVPGVEDLDYWLSEFCEEHVSPDIFENDPLNGVIADTNAVGWHVEQYDTQEVQLQFLKRFTIKAKIWFTACGEEDGEHMACGSSMEGTFTLTLSHNGKLPDRGGSFDWEVTDIKCELDIDRDRREEMEREDAQIDDFDDQFDDSSYLP